jgi:hypothetical protein
MTFRYGSILIALLTAALLSGCGPPEWAIEKWGEDQYMSYRIDARNLALFTCPRMSYSYDSEAVRTAVSKIYGTILSEDGQKNLVVFIHGRGKYPEYVDVSAAGVNHDYYIGAGRPETLAAFYRNVVMDTGVDPLKGPGVLETDRTRVYAVSP